MLHYLWTLVNCLFLFPATEWMGTSKRSWATGVTQLFGTVGQCIMTGLVYALRDWRLTQSITAALCAVSFIYIWYAHLLLFPLSFTTPIDQYILNRLIPESARWLLTRGRTDEAKQLIDKVAKINKRTPPQFLQAPVLAIVLQIWHFGKKMIITAVTNWLNMTMMVCLLLCILDCWDDTWEKDKCFSFQIICAKEVLCDCNDCEVSHMSSLIKNVCSQVWNKWRKT